VPVEPQVQEVASVDRPEDHGYAHRDPVGRHVRLERRLHQAQGRRDLQRHAHPWHRLHPRQFRRHPRHPDVRGQALGCLDQAAAPCDWQLLLRGDPRRHDG